MIGYRTGDTITYVVDTATPAPAVGTVHGVHASASGGAPHGYVVALAPGVRRYVPAGYVLAATPAPRVPTRGRHRRTGRVRRAVLEMLDGMVVTLRSALVAVVLLLAAGVRPPH